MRLHLVLTADREVVAEWDVAEAFGDLSRPEVRRLLADSVAEEVERATAGRSSFPDELTEDP